MDIKILKHLIKDANISLKNLSIKLNKSYPFLVKSIKNLEKNKIGEGKII